MSGFNFGQIGNIMSELFDTDYVDIKRDSGGSLKELYSNIPCHIAFASTDNPDPTSVDTKPIIESIHVHFPVWVDVKNNDFLVAKRMDGGGNLLKTYSGRCGDPIVSQGRQKVLMTMSGTESEEPTPVPPKNPVVIIIRYLSDGIPVQDQLEEKMEAGGSFRMTAPVIEGYSADYCYVDGELQESTSVYIPSVADAGHTVDFIYSVSDTPTMMRFLVNGLYTKDDGSLGAGWHQYKKIDLDSVSKDGDIYSISCDNVKWIHEDNGRTLEIKPGVKLVLIPGNIFVTVNAVTVTGNKVVFTATEYEPDEAERNSYVAGWYD